MSVDLSEFRAKPVKRCVVAIRTEQMTDDDQAKYHAAMAADDITNASIVRFLINRGLVMNADSLRRHRSGICGCG